jgi:AcrR family transcriptional regulator
VGRVSASEVDRTETDGPEPGRLPRADRRDALLDAAAALVAAGDIDAVSMETVAEKAGVSRPLVYKHFANRRELLAEVYRREAALLHDELAAAVSAADTIEGRFRALVHGALAAEADRGAALSALRAAGGRNRQLREEQRARDRVTVRWFARQAVRELAMDERRARAGASILLRAIESVLAEWRLRPTPARAALLEDTYVSIAMGALERLAAE